MERHLVGGFDVIVLVLSVTFLHLLSCPQYLNMEFNFQSVLRSYCGDIGKPAL